MVEWDAGSMTQFKRALSVNSLNIFGVRFDKISESTCIDTPFPFMSPISIDQKRIWNAGEIFQGSKLGKKWWTRCYSSFKMEDETPIQSEADSTLLKSHVRDLCNLPYVHFKLFMGRDGIRTKDVFWWSIEPAATSASHEARVLQGRGRVIKDLFPRMLALELNKNATVSSN
ncbi:hypothetical protein Tco_0246690 [Tanacetum coccineum]